MDSFNYIIEKFKLEKVWAGTPINGSRNKELLDLFRELGFKIGVEIGTETGVYSEQIMKSIPDLTLYCVDPWKAYSGYREHLSQEYMDELYKTTVKKLKPYNCKIVRNFSEKAYKKFEDESIDFVYIDGNHDFLHVTQDIAFWSPKVRKDGIIAGHDFIRTKAHPMRVTNNVKDVVPSYAYGAGIPVWFVIQTTNESPSWFWVKT